MSTLSYEEQLNDIEQRYWEQKAANQDPGPDMRLFLETLCRAYPDMGATERGAVRAAMRRCKAARYILEGCITQFANKIHSAADIDWLAMGLAAASLEDSSVDYRDWLLAVAFLYASAEWVGIDPRPQFQIYAELSSCEQPSGGPTPVCQILANFHNYAVLGDGRRQVRHRRK